MMKLNRRNALLAGSMLAAASLLPGAAFAQNDDRAAIRAAAEAQKDASVARIQHWIRNPSIAAQNLNMQEGAEYMAALARDAGFQEVEIVLTDGHPGVFATYDVGAARTLGVYFMYDVKQFDPSEWSSPPTEAAFVDKEGFGRAIMGRGATNQKGPEATFLAALHAFKQAGVTLPVNLVLIAEGEEEIGSPHFSQITAKPHIMEALKRTEGIFIPAGWQDKSGAVEVSLGSKGIVELELISSGESWGPGPDKDIHSSLKAAVESPAWRLVYALQTLVKDDGNKVAIDGWFENVRPLTEREKALIAEAAGKVDPEEQKRMLGIDSWIDDLSYPDAMTRLAQEPTVNIEGLVAGYTGEGGKTILPGRAVAKLDLRLVPNQTRAEAEEKLRAHLDAAGYPDIEVKVTGGYDPTETPENTRLMQSILATYRQNDVPATLIPRSAGSWPGAMFTAPPLSLPAGHFGMGHGSGAHAPDEYYVIDSTNPAVKGLVDATMGYVDLLYQVAGAD